MKKSSSITAASLMSAVLLAGLTAGAATIFSEGFSGSTVMSATPAAPTATTTDYAVMSSKNATGSSIGSTLDLSMPSTSSGFAEMQALFTTTPVTLGAGESITLQMSFKPTGLLISSANQSINFGLYNSGGSGPVPGGGMANGGMSSSLTNYVSGYAQNWAGYVGRLGGGGNASSLITRDPQTDTVNENQDALFNNAGGGAFDNPSGQTLTSPGVETILTDGQDYTLTLTVLNSGSDVQVTEAIYSGIGTGGASIYSLTGTAPVGYEYTTFDALAFGYRGISGSTMHLDISALSVDVIPEPATIGLVGLFGAGILFIRRIRI